MVKRKDFPFVARRFLSCMEMERVGLDAFVGKSSLLFLDSQAEAPGYSLSFPFIVFCYC